MLDSERRVIARHDSWGGEDERNDGAECERIFSAECELSSEQRTEAGRECDQDRVQRAAAVMIDNEAG